MHQIVSEKNTVGLAVIILSVLLTQFVPQFGLILAVAEGVGKRLAEKRGLAILAIAGATIILRLSLLGILPVPVPRIHDEFSYLLAADTFAHSRLTNARHPMWIYFDTFHVNQYPTYMSKYPPAQGAALALGQLFGHPWIGVVLSVAGMCAATLWMLQGWLPAPWALVGATLLLLRWGVFSYWINSYWGGAMAAVGGALVMGALPRILRLLCARDVWLLGLGIAILVNSRPFEGLVLCLPVFWVLVSEIKKRQSPSMREIIERALLPLCLVALCSGSFVLYYNWRGTGSPFLFPYVANDRAYMNTPPFVWQKSTQLHHYTNPQFESFYNGSERNSWAMGRADSIRHGVSVLSWDVRAFVYFFLRPELCIPLIALPWLLRDRRVQFLTVQFSICFLAFLSVAWFQPHYAAPLIATTYALVTQCIRHLRQWQFRGRTIGTGLSRAVILSAITLAPLHQLELGNLPEMENRARLAAQLSAMPGEHLVIVRYSTQHNVLAEWVYNDADIDHAKTVWAREIPGVDLHPLLNYFRGRKVWLVDADNNHPQLASYHAVDEEPSVRGTCMRLDNTIVGVK